jgi:two-component system, cell cycle response regulator DivK
MSKRILVVEDQPDNRQIIRDMLAPTDYEITEVESGEEALTAIAKQPPDLILMDIQLPIMDGYTATRRIKADPALRSIKIIAVTSYALSGEEKKAREAGCDDYVPKPFSPRQLQAKSSNTSPKTGLIAAVHESAFGTKRTLQNVGLMSAFRGKADIVRCYRISSSWHNPYKD